VDEYHPMKRMAARGLLDDHVVDRNADHPEDDETAGEAPA
jgi:hypothetical protein